MATRVRVSLTTFFFLGLFLLLYPPALYGVEELKNVKVNCRRALPDNYTALSYKPSVEMACKPSPMKGRMLTVAPETRQMVVDWQWDERTRESYPVTVSVTPTVAWQPLVLELLIIAFTSALAGLLIGRM